MKDRAPWSRHVASALLLLPLVVEWKVVPSQLETARGTVLLAALVSVQLAALAWMGLRSGLRRVRGLRPGVVLLGGFAVVTVGFLCADLLWRHRA